MDQPTAEQSLARLERLVGDWEVEAVWPGDAVAPARGRSTFTWHESKAHVVWTSTMDDPVPDSVSIIGCDAASGGYVSLYSDERGVCRVYRMSIDENEWMLWRDGTPFGQRFVAHTGEGGDTLTGGWEIEEQGAFAHDFTITYRRIR